MSFNLTLKKDRDFLKLLFHIIQPSHVVWPTEDGRSMTTFYYCSVNHQSEKHTLKLSHILLMSIKMCHKLCHFIWGVWWFHSKIILKLWRQETWPFSPGWATHITRIHSWTFRLLRCDLENIWSYWVFSKYDHIVLFWLKWQRVTPKSIANYIFDVKATLFLVQHFYWYQLHTNLTNW